MPSFKRILEVMVVGLASVAYALPGQPKISSRALGAYNIVTRQATSTGLPAGLSDVDILQFALTLEFLEAAFYQQGFAKFPDSDFAALGLSQQQISDLKNIGATEEAHVSTLLGAIAGAGIKPVAPCEYKFGLTTAKDMVATASILENIGVSAYLAAAPLLTTPAILSVAASIATVEARHQTFIRAASQVIAVPSAFDTPLGVRSVFSLAAGFIASCPEGSNLAVTPFTSAEMTSPDASSKIVAGTSLKIQTTAPGGSFCSFTDAQLPGGSAFVPFTNGACEVPQNLAGQVYVHITSAGPISGVLTDDITLAGPVVVVIS